MTNFSVQLLRSVFRLGVFCSPSNENAAFFEKHLQASCVRYTWFSNTKSRVRYKISFCLGGGLTDLLSNLTQVAQQGVLWLNTCLTVRAHKAHSHSKQGWETFTTAVLKAVTTRIAEKEEGETRKGVVFMAWGAPALKICQSIGVNSVRIHPTFIRHHSINLELLASVQEEPPIEVVFFLVKFRLWLTFLIQVCSPVSFVRPQGILGELPLQNG